MFAFEKRDCCLFVVVAGRSKKLQLNAGAAAKERERERGGTGARISSSWLIYGCHRMQQSIKDTGSLKAANKPLNKIGQKRQLERTRKWQQVAADDCQEAVACVLCI